MRATGEISFESFVAGEADNINMIELAGQEANEDDVVAAFELAHQEIKKIIEFQNKIIKELGKQKLELKFSNNENLKKEIKDFLKDKLEAAIYVDAKTERVNNLDNLLKELKNHLIEKEFEIKGEVDHIFEEEVDDLVHLNVLKFDRRPDDRKLDEVRPLYTEISLFKRLHGSALFMRGDTQALAIVTLAPPGAEQLVETMEASSKRRFMLHYNFPPYCTGEIGRLGMPGRREIGHGNLAEKAVRQVIPTQDEFPYTIRVVSEILSSNGSSSMATTCAASMALMDAGVPIKKPVAGIAMGLITDDKGNYKILTDIQGPEDHYGDMDCKVAGTANGITAIQMDVKINGVTPKILREVFKQAKKARCGILDFIKKTIAEPKEKISSYAPAILTMEINPEQIGEVIGSGGKVINAIIKDTGVISIDIEKTGKIFVAADSLEKANSAIEFIKSLTKEFKVGEIIEGNIIKILDFGAIVDLGGGQDGMIHVSELKNGFVNKVEDVVKLGDFVRAKIIKVDNDKIGLSIKALGDK